MTATYIPGALGESTDDARLYRVRLELGDVDTAAALLQDEEINYYLSVSSNDEDAAAVRAARALLTRYGAQPTRVSLPDGTSADFSARVETWNALIARLDTANTGFRIRRVARPQAVGNGGEYS
jgi:hypothetical protein